MKLTDREKMFIAQRAGGSYAILPTIKRIVSEHAKNKTPEDQIFLEFGRLVCQQTIPWDNYERLARAVLKIFPEPFGPPWKPRAPEEPLPGPYPESKPVLTKRQRKCGICSGSGHNARTCPNKPNTPTVTYTDGIERLSPGFDPNPPG